MTPILILDGGLGTSLEQKYHIKFGPSRPLWSTDLVVSAPHTLLQCQSDFGRLPVDILLTATYQVSVRAFNNTCHSHTSFPRGIGASDIPRFLERAVCIAESATQQQQHQPQQQEQQEQPHHQEEEEDEEEQQGQRRQHEGARASVALSLGPYGATMIPSQEYSGQYDSQHDSQASLYEWHRERLALFGKVDGLSSRVSHLAMETIPRVDEIAAMRRALDAVPELAGVPFWMSCLFPGEGQVLPTGETIQEALRTMFDASVARCLPWGVGINCTKVRKVPALLERYEEVVADMVREGIVAEWPALVLYPDGTNGEVYNTATQEWELPQQDTTTQDKKLPWEQQLVEAVRATQSRGKWKQIVVGGCCMTSSEDIARLRNILL
ncbi:hypothetical protein E4U43_004122 [Claviceps pusilla]|uniref:Hcy-binding domain-containing protein n=1 Tax=Claviceps pusilla TaxID=123648 RepID=A0A9P7N6A9_9HYPO|nr:hypothetical protein E4U43_004122 [Claviceps pusilla]